ncbi:MAG: peroxidase-related enzyme [Rhodothermaceae bacterium]|nr:peroxidase-related enzyme [Rhodothermaceae bacterium]
MSWISTVSYAVSSGKLRALFDRVKRPDGYIDNILLVHGLRPHTLEGHMKLYKNVLHHSGNTIPKWFLETLGVYVSALNECAYCVEHHFAGLKKVLENDTRAEAIRNALKQKNFDSVFDEKERSALFYAEQLTLHPAALTDAFVEAMRSQGWEDGQILEINQVVSYFSYANRTVLGLGVSLDGDVLGLSPNDASDSDNWQHS